MFRLTGVDITRCPVGQQGHLRFVALFGPGQIPAPALDTSSLRPSRADRPLSPPRRTWRDGGVCPRVSPPALRRFGLPSLALGPPPVPAGVPVVGGHKALPFAPGFGYNPHSW